MLKQQTIPVGDIDTIVNAIDRQKVSIKAKRRENFPEHSFSRAHKFSRLSRDANPRKFLIFRERIFFRLSIRKSFPITVRSEKAIEMESSIASW